MYARAGIERRQQPRKLLDIEVFLSCRDDPTASHTFSIFDISLSGMALHSDSLLPKLGDKLSLCLSAKSQQCSQDHVIEATVVHVHEGHVGIRFDSVGVHVLKDIQLLLRDGRTF